VDDILVVAPYNLQVHALRQALPSGARVGTIDKFQGQEAPVVIISTCATPEAAIGGLDDPCDSGLNREQLDDDNLSDHRGTRFALRRNRLNVALSRAQCLAIVIGSEHLVTEAACRYPEDAEVLSFYRKIIDHGLAGLRGLNCKEARAGERSNA
jgi:uncharacterized protein